MWAESEIVLVSAAVADAFLAGDWSEEGLLARAAHVLNAPRPRWLRPLARRALATYRERPADRPSEFRAWLEVELRETARRNRRVPVVAHRLFAEPAMGRMRWPVPPIATTTDLAAFLDLHRRELEWLADARGWERDASSEQLRNYRYAWIPRANGPPRLLEAPKRHLKELQRRVLHQILDVIPPHENAQGFRRGHSALTHARRHVGRHVVIGVDVEDFFASISAARVYGIFRGVGYPEQVAYRLTALCTNVVPRHVVEALPQPEERRLLAARTRLAQRLAVPHLPQGAPTSPALANLSAHALDRRLSALALRIGASYSRYADDLAFSGGRRLLAHASEIRAHVAEIVRDEGFRLNVGKSRLTTQAGRQRVTGIVVNRHPNVDRREFDRLKAILHDAALHGPTAANRSHVGDFRAHLLGRISWVDALNPGRGAQLRTRFAQIDWNTPP